MVLNSLINKEKGLLVWILIISLISAIIFEASIKIISIPITLLNSYLIFLLSRRGKNRIWNQTWLPLFVFLIMLPNLFSSFPILLLFGILASLSLIIGIFKKKRGDNSVIYSITAAFIVYLLYLLLTIINPILIIMLHAFFFILIVIIKEKNIAIFELKGLMQTKKIIKSTLIFLLLALILTMGKLWPLWFCFLISLTIFISSIMHNKISKKRIWRKTKKMLGIKVKIEKAQETIEKLKRLELLSNKAKVEKVGKNALIPLKKAPAKKINILKEKFNIIEHNFSLKKEEKSFSELAKEIVPERLHPKLKTAFDIVGDIGILEIDKELREYETELGKALLKSQNNLKTAVRKEGSHQTEFRVQKHKFLAGERKTTTLHKENNIAVELDINKMYFSPRLSTERKRISLLVKKGEDVLVMFSGAAPYGCVIAKNSPAKHITGIELNPQAHKFGQRNLKRNKIKNADLINGDVKEVAKGLEREYDRIIMPLPKGAEKFLSEALKCAKNRCAIHLYQFVSLEETNNLKKDIQKRIEKEGWTILSIKMVRCGQQAPNVYRICFDIDVAKK